MNIYIVCPVRNPPVGWKEGLLDYTTFLENQGHKVHLPFRDTPQDDPSGLSICDNHLRAMKRAGEVHLAYDGKSEGCLFDLGMAFALGKLIVPITGYFPKQTVGKSYSNMVWAWNARNYELFKAPFRGEW